MNLPALTITPEKINLLKVRSVQLRQAILMMIYTARAGHTGGSLSCVDILNVLYNHLMNITPENFAQFSRDHYIHSKGHLIETLYAVLADKGFFSADLLGGIEKYGSDFIGHSTRSVLGVEQNIGALGHGFFLAIGMALATKKRRTHRPGIHYHG